MIFTETKLKGAFIIDVERLEDHRGFFGRSYCKSEFAEWGFNFDILQANISFNKKAGTLRGMHMQAAPYGEDKLVRCSRGAIYDVIIDMREDAETYTQWIGIELTADAYRMLYIPKGFAHGFITLKNNTEVTYQIGQFYMPAAEVAYRWNDKAFNIDWPIQPVVISKKDLSYPLFQDKSLVKI